MKRILLIANCVLAAAVVALYVLYFTNQSNKTSHSQIFTETASELPSGSIVYFHLDSLLNGLELFQALRSDLEVKVKAADDDLNKKGRAFERDATDFQDKVQKGLLTTIQRQTQQAQLETRQRELEQYVQQKQMEIAEEEQVMMNNVLNEINLFIAAYNLEHNFSLILTTNGNPGAVISGNPSLNITKDVMTGLNAQYASGKKR